MKIAITGASGFIGQHVMNALIKKSVQVTAVTRNPEKLSKFAKSASIVKLDIGKADNDVFNILGKPDILIHLAWEGLPNYKSLHHFEIELPRQYAFLKKMIKGGLCRVIVTGTCQEYGMQSGALSEKTETKPGTPYAFAKDALRKELEFLKMHIDFELTWARLFYLYGEGQSEKSLFPQLKKAVLSGKSSFEMSGGEQLRDYLPICDVAEHILSLCIKNNDYGIVNVCSGKPISVRRLVEQLMSKNSWTINLNLGAYPYPDYEPMAFWGSNDKLMNILNG